MYIQLSHKSRRKFHVVNYLSTKCHTSVVLSPTLHSAGSGLEINKTAIYPESIFLWFSSTPEGNSGSACKYVMAASFHNLSN